VARDGGGDGWAVAVAWKNEMKKNEVKKKSISVYVRKLCRVPAIWHSAKIFFNLKINFAKCPESGTRQRSLCRVPTNKHSAKNGFRVLNKSLPSVPRLALGKAFFAECHPRTLSKEYFLFFSIQTFCGMFLHYVDLHVPFWHNYKSVFYNY
jgi:hypothetical protein